MAEKEEHSLLSNATLTVRVIRSFEHRNWKPVVLHNCDLSMTCADLRERINKAISDNQSLPPPFKNARFYNAIKLETDPSSNFAKSSNALINTSSTLPVVEFHSGEEDKNNTLVSEQSTLVSLGFRHESEVSYFNLAEYTKYMSTI